MYNCQTANNNILCFASDAIKSAVECHIEHEKDTDSVIMFNTGFDEYYYLHQNNLFEGKKAIYYDLEHKCPIDENGQMSFCSVEWTNNFNKILETYNEIWDFQLENYEYFKFHKLDKLFRFKPLRYTTWFKQFYEDIVPKYDIQLECVVDTQTRMNVFMVLTNEPYRILEDGDVERNNPRISIKMTNTFNAELKLREKNDCLYGIDFPHYDTPCTINCFRIYEYICMNKPVIVWDRDRLSSRNYYGDLCVWVDDFNTWDLKKITQTQPRKDVAETYKQMTYLDKDYDEYRLNIIRDYKNKTGISVPDYVMY